MSLAVAAAAQPLNAAPIDDRAIGTPIPNQAEQVCVWLVHCPHCCMTALRASTAMRRLAACLCRTIMPIDSRVQICKQYASYGFCGNDGCALSHDIQAVLDAHGVRPSPHALKQSTRAADGAKRRRHKAGVTERKKSELKYFGHTLQCWACGRAEHTSAECAETEDIDGELIRPPAAKLRLTPTDPFERFEPLPPEDSPTRAIRAEANHLGTAMLASPSALSHLSLSSPCTARGADGVPSGHAGALGSAALGTLAAADTAGAAEYGTSKRKADSVMQESNADRAQRLSDAAHSSAVDAYQTGVVFLGMCIDAGARRVDSLRNKLYLPGTSNPLQLRKSGI